MHSVTQIAAIAIRSKVIFRLVVLARRIDDLFCGRTCHGTLHINTADFSKLTASADGYVSDR